jgi:Rod binding domain-containing protein
MNISASLPVIQPAAPVSASQNTQKVVGAAQQFEAILLNTLLGPLQKSFSALPGSSEDSNSSAYQDLGVQTLAGGLASAGGFGIANMIARSLLKIQGHTAAEAPKVSAK